MTQSQGEPVPKTGVNRCVGSKVIGSQQRHARPAEAAGKHGRKVNRNGESIVGGSHDPTPVFYGPHTAMRRCCSAARSGRTSRHSKCYEELRAIRGEPANLAGIGCLVADETPNV